MTHEKAILEIASGRRGKTYHDALKFIVEMATKWHDNSYPNEWQKKNCFSVSWMNPFYKYDPDNQGHPVRYFYCQSIEECLDLFQKGMAKLDSDDETHGVIMRQTHTGKTILSIRGSSSGKWVVGNIYKGV